MSAAIILSALLLVAIVLTTGFVLGQRAITQTAVTADPAFFQDNPQAMVIYDPATLQFLDVNNAALAQYGFSRNAFLSMYVHDIEQDIQRFQASRDDLPDALISSGWHHRTNHGKVIDVDMMSRSMTYKGRRARLVTMIDVTERTHNATLLKASEAALAAAQELAQLGSFQVNCRTNTHSWTPQMYRIYGLPEGSPVPAEGRHAYDHPADEIRVHTAIMDARFKHCPYDFDHRIVRADGLLRYVHEQGRFTYDAQGQPLENIGTVIDITDRKNAQAELAQLAYHDSLTGLPNRTQLIEQLEILFDESTEETRVALLFIDLDRFKIINDTLGHRYGDDVLIEVGMRLRAGLRDTDIVARPGGDEFIIALQDVADKLEVSRAADKILASFEKPFFIAGHEHLISASIGVSLFPADGRAVETLLQSADSAMYAAKARGGNNFHFYTSNLQADAARRFKLESAIRRAIEHSEFAIHYQPVLSVESGAIVAAEALIRWNDPELGIVMPGEFIPFAEETGLIVPMGDWIFLEACVQAKLWSAGGHRIKIWINVSAAQLHHPNFVASVRDGLVQTGLNSSQIGLELTESAFIDGRSETIAALRELRGLGVSLALDDFGVAYSSLDYVRRLPIDTIKIDRSFLRDIATDRFNQSIVRGIVGIAHDLHFRVTAEGVETTAQYDFLRDLGCDDWQGFYYGEAETAAAFSHLLGAPRVHNPVEQTYFGKATG
ncbi:MAG: hypothetical protein NVSMB31_00270 [Vulcanimicrobiaceae bacterium]